jgi:hypothetical protein
MIVKKNSPIALRVSSCSLTLCRAIPRACGIEAQTRRGGQRIANNAASLPAVTQHELVFVRPWNPLHFRDVIKRRQTHSKNTHGASSFHEIFQARLDILTDSCSSAHEFKARSFRALPHNSTCVLL